MIISAPSSLCTLSNMYNLVVHPARHGSYIARLAWWYEVDWMSGHINIYKMTSSMLLYPRSQALRFLWYSSGMCKRSTFSDYEGFLTALKPDLLTSFMPGSPPRWGLRGILSFTIPSISPASRGTATKAAGRFNITATC